jgi:hypothetical protein
VDYVPPVRYVYERRSTAPPPPPLPPPRRSRVEPAVYHPPVIYRAPHHTHPMVTWHPVRVLRSWALRIKGESRLSLNPMSVREALADPNWRRAMEEEYGALLANQTWDLVSHLSGCNLVTGKWIWTIKQRVDGTLEHYKARWVLRGFTKRPCVDYDETFSPVVKPAIVRAHCSLSSSFSILAGAPARCQECISS